MKINNNQILIKVNPKIYPMEAIYGASFIFLDRAYVKLDGDPEKNVLVYLKGKKALTKNELKNLAGEFLNELLNYTLRNLISKENKTLREYIVAQALISTEIGGASQEAQILPEECPTCKEKEEGEKEDWQKDPLGIAIPWEEKYGKKKAKKKFSKSKI